VKAGITTSDKNLFRELKSREEMLSTAIGNGIAIPHPRNPSSNLFKKLNVIIARLKKGVDFYAPDNEKVHLFFMTCAPNVVAHLKLLAKIAKLLHTKDIFQKFMNATSKTEIIRILLEAERINIQSFEEIHA
jgi:PTS system nitrogen regulatory IIA component